MWRARITGLPETGSLMSRPTTRMLAEVVDAAETSVRLGMASRKSVAVDVRTVTGPGTSRPAKPVTFIWNVPPDILVELGTTVPLKPQLRRTTRLPVTADGLV